MKSIIKKAAPSKLLSSCRKIKMVLFSSMPRDFSNIYNYGFGAPRHSQRFYLNPAEVECAMEVERWRRKDTGRIVGGDWDLFIKNIDDIKKIRMVKERLLQEKTWEEAGAYEIMRELLEKHTRYDDCASLNDIFRRYERLDGIIENIRTGRGFVTMPEIDRGNFRESGGVFIHIGRNGNFIFGHGGCHRLAIAQALGIKKIPVQVGVVHKTAVENGLWREVLQGVSRVKSSAANYTILE